jgi:hypothetical protein
MKLLTNKGIDEIEGALGRETPRFYRKLLVEVGFGESGDIELYHPKEIDELYEFKFDDEERFPHDRHAGYRMYQQTNSSEHWPFICSHSGKMMRWQQALDQGLMTLGRMVGLSSFNLSCLYSQVGNTYDIPTRI